MESEKTNVIKALQESHLLRNYGFVAEIILPIVPYSFLQRITNSQLLIQASSLNNFFRSWEIYKHLDKISLGNVNEKIKKILGQNPLDAYRAVFALFSILNSNKNKDLKPFLHIGSPTYNAQLLNISNDTLLLTASRLSQDISEFKRWHKKIAGIPEVLKKYYPLPFYERPLIHAKELTLIKGQRDMLFLCPSPRLFIHAMSTFAFRLLSENKHLFKPRNLLSDFGTALENYFSDVLPKIFPAATIHQIRDPSSKNADFVLELEKFILIIECKRNIDSRLSRTVIQGDDLIKTWERILGALIQCSETKKNINLWVENSKKPIICFVLTENVISGQDAIFNYASSKCGVLKKLNIEQFEILAMHDFERIFSSCNADDVLNDCLLNWSNFRENCYINTFTPILNGKSIPARKPFKHLNLCFTELFPQLQNPFT